LSLAHQYAMQTATPFPVAAAEDGHTVAKVLRSRMHESQPSWNDVRSLIAARRVTVNETVVTDPARRLKEGDVVALLTKPAAQAKGSTPADIAIRHLDDHVVVVEKPAGMNTVRHPAELEWSEERRKLDPTLQDVTQWAIGRKLNRPARSLPPLRIVQRLDRETSGLVVFARSVLAERGLGMQFRKHTVVRKYLALVPGIFSARTIRSELVRDRGDGYRGSSPLPGAGKLAVTHVTVEEQFRGFTLVGCRLETGKTHQIRIHLSEAGHPICGEKVYTRTPDGRTVTDTSGAPRLFLHAVELGFDHPASGEKLHWTMPLPAELAAVLGRLRGR
jgi:23S rRNA pseudouridine1911/1915/1917 synthase